MSMPPRREAPQPPREQPKPRREEPKPKPAGPKLTPRRWSPQIVMYGVGGLLLVIFIWYLLSRNGNETKSPPANMAPLTITTTPKEAAVFLDGDFIGNTPLTNYRANAGKFSLRIQKPNYFSRDTTITLVKGREAKFTFVLQPAAGHVTIAVDPPDADVIVDGESIASSRRQRLPLSIGTHSLNLSAEGYKSVQTQFRVTPRDTTLQYALKREVLAEYGVIGLTSYLTGKVYIDANFAGNISAGETREYDQPVGPHKVEVRGANETVSQNVTVAKGKSVTVTLRPKPAAAPPEAKPVPEYSLRRVARNNLAGETVKAVLRQYDFYCGEYSWSQEWSNPQGRGLPNDFVLQSGGKIVLDRATGLMWQQSGSGEYMTYDKAPAYIAQLNRANFAGYSDWRLPTLEEAMSLMESKKLNEDLYIDPKFDKTQRYIWTADKESAGVAWVADFYGGYCGRYNVGFINYVRAVRAGQ